MARAKFLLKGEKITCYNQSQMLTCLTILEQEGFVWINGGERATEWLPWERVIDFKFPCSINWHSEGKICQGSYPGGREWSLVD